MALEFTSRLSLVSIQLISPASGELYTRIESGSLQPGFHSINFPSEWGGRCPAVVHIFRKGDGNVSIQLISPASGEVIAQNAALVHHQDVSIQLISPASGEH